MSNMEEDDESIYISSGNAKSVEVLPEMLDYAFVDTCESANELLAVLKALKSGEWGSYTDLENYTRKKLIGVSSESGKKRICAIATKSSPSDAIEESESLHGWLDHLSSKSCADDSSNSILAKPKRKNEIPVRDVKRTDITKVETSSDLKGTTPISKKIINKPLSKVMTQECIFRLSYQIISHHYSLRHLVLYCLEFRNTSTDGISLKHSIHQTTSRRWLIKVAAKANQTLRRLVAEQKQSDLSCRSA